MIKVLALCATLVAAVLLQPTVVHAKVEGGKNGMYVEVISNGFGKGSTIYRVDTVARICLVGVMTKTQVAVPIPRENLARRPGWAEIITWVEPLPDTSE